MIIWLLVVYMWLYIHRLFEMVEIFGGHNLTHSYMVALAVVWLLGLNSKRKLGNVFTLSLFLYTFAIIAAALSSPSIPILDNFNVKNWLLNIAFFLILMTSVRTQRDLKIIMTGYLVAYFIFLSHSYWVYLSGRTLSSMGVARLSGVRGSEGQPGGEGLRDPNYFSTTLVCALPMLIPLMALGKKYWHYLFALTYALLAVRCAILSGSRNTFLMLLSLMVLSVLFSRHRFKLLPIILVALPIGWVAMPEEMHRRYQSIWDPSLERMYAMRGANASMEGRLHGFYNGFATLLRNPITGVGPGGTRYTELGMAAHNLPGQVAGELGTLGIVTFLFMVSCFGINHYKNWKNYKYLREKNLDKEIRYCWWVSIGSMYALAMMGMQGIGLHNAYFYPWVWFGAFLALATTLIQERVDADIRGKLLPSLPNLKS